MSPAISEGVRIGSFFFFYNRPFYPGDRVCIAPALPDGGGGHPAENGSCFEPLVRGSIRFFQPRCTFVRSDASHASHRQPRILPHQPLAEISEIHLRAGSAPFSCCQSGINSLSETHCLFLTLQFLLPSIQTFTHSAYLPSAFFQCFFCYQGSLDDVHSRIPENDEGCIFFFAYLLVHSLNCSCGFQMGIQA